MANKVTSAEGLLLGRGSAEWVGVGGFEIHSGFEHETSKK